MAENPKTEWFPAIQKGWFSASSGWTKSLRTSLDGETNGQFTGYIAYMHTFVHRYVGGGHSRKWTQEGESSGQEVAGGDVVRVRSCIADAPWIFKPGSLWEATLRIPDALMFCWFSCFRQVMRSNLKMKWTRLVCFSDKVWLIWWWHFSCCRSTKLFKTLKVF